MKSDFWVATDTQYYIAGLKHESGEERRRAEELRGFRQLKMEEQFNRRRPGLPAAGRRSPSANTTAMKKPWTYSKELPQTKYSSPRAFRPGGASGRRRQSAGNVSNGHSDHFPPRIKKGAPIQALLAEGVGEIGGAVSVLKGAPHPDAALLWARWAISEEGQRVWAQAGETPAHPNVEPLEKVRPTATYMLTIDDIKEFPKYQKIWKEIFQIR